MLAYVKNSQQSTSTGKYKLENQRLSLNGNDGLKLEGTIRSQSSSEFQFQPAGGTTLVFKRAK
jgi:hypothetical protein